MTPAYIYLYIQDPDLWLVKVGQTHDLPGREAAFRTVLPDGRMFLSVEVPEAVVDDAERAAIQALADAKFDRVGTEVFAVPTAELYLAARAVLDALIRTVPDVRSRPTLWSVFGDGSPPPDGPLRLSALFEEDD